MKTALFAAALLFGTAAIAQEMQPAQDASTGTAMSAPSNSAPETDARGIPVVSDPAEVPAGANQAAQIAPGAQFQPNPNQGQVFTPRPASEEYPACSRTVTDNCVQAYEVGRPRR
jgi:hypothetical protein